MSTKARLWIPALLLCLSFATPALADATVVVELKTSNGAVADGTVELTQGEAKYGCTTDKGRCEIKGVSGGMYTVEVKQVGRASPKPKTVMIPPSGEVKLIVNAT